MDIGLISIVLVLGLVFLLAIGMPLGFASAILAVVVMVMKFEPNLLLDPDWEPHVPKRKSGGPGIFRPTWQMPPRCHRAPAALTARRDRAVHIFGLFVWRIR